MKLKKENYPRFFIKCALGSCNQATITGTDVDHIKKVLRLSLHSLVELTDIEGNTYLMEIISFPDNGNIHLKRLSLISGKRTVSSVEVILGQAVPKSIKMDLIVKMSTQLGVSRITPLITKRVVMNADRLLEKKNRITRWRKIGEEACKQSKRDTLVVVDEFLTVTSFIENSKDCDVKWILHERGNNSIKEVIRSMKNRPDKLAFMVGPEGGFTESEIEMAVKNSFIPIKLGNNILRTETSSISLLSILNYEFL